MQERFGFEWDITRVPEDDPEWDWPPPPPVRHAVNMVTVGSDPRDLGEVSPGFERAEKDVLCDGPTLDWDSSSEASSQEAGDYETWQEDWLSEGETETQHPPPQTGQDESSSSWNISMVRKSTARRSKKSTPGTKSDSDDSDEEETGGELVLIPPTPPSFGPQMSSSSPPLFLFRRLPPGPWCPSQMRMQSQPCTIQPTHKQGSQSLKGRRGWLCRKTWEGFF
jgi:hypothetical protein